MQHTVMAAYRKNTGCKKGFGDKASTRERMTDSTDTETDENTMDLTHF